MGSFPKLHRGVLKTLAVGALILITVYLHSWTNQVAVSTVRRPQAQPVVSRRVHKKTVHLNHYIRHCELDQLDALSPLSDSRQATQNHTFDLVKAKSSISCPRKLQRANTTKWSAKRTWLLSQPGSGNTWTRHILQEMTGILTGSVYHDGKLLTHGFPAEGETDDVVAIKAHSMWAIGARTEIKISPETDRLIIVIRNPYNSIVSHYKGDIARVGHTGNTFIDPKSITWLRFVQYKSSNWKRNTFESIMSDLEKIIVFYEDLRSDLLPQLMRVANFLSSESLNEFAFCCTLRNSEGLQHRMSSNQTAQELYSKDSRTQINAELAELASSLLSHYPEVAQRLLTYVMPTCRQHVNMCH